MVVPVAIIIAAAALVILVVMLIGLMRQSLRLARAVTDFQRAIRPALEEIRVDAEQAQSRINRLSERRATMSSPKRKGR